MKQTILARAKRLQERLPGGRQRHIISKEDIELAVAWAKGQVTLSQVRRVLELKHSEQGYMRLAMALREYVKEK